MADEVDESLGGDDTAKLTADVAPWEAALDKAAAKVGEWATTVEGKFQAAGDKITGFTAKAGSQLEAMTAKGGGDIGAGFAATVGEGVGRLAGGALGTVFGPVGTLIGQQLGGAVGAKLGDYIAENINAENVAALIGSTLKDVDAQVAAVGESWGSVKQDAADAFAGIKDTLRAVNIADLFADGIAGIPGKLAELATTVGDQLNSFGQQATARFADLINGAFERFKEPIGQVADGIQFLLEKLGLVGDATEKWSESLNRVKDVSKTVVGALAYAFGTLEDVVSLVANSIRVSLFTALKFIGEQIQTLVKTYADVWDKLGIAALVGIDTAAIRQGADDLGNAFGEGMADAIRQADKEMGTALEFGTGAKRRKQVTEGVEVGRQKNFDVDNDRMMDDFTARMLAGFKPVENEIAAAAGGSFKGIEATIEGSREGAKLAAQDANRGMGGDIARQGVDAAKASVDATKGVKAAVDQVNKTLEKGTPLKSI